MSALLLLLPISIVLVALIAWALYWAIGSGQFDDLDGPAYRVLMDDDGPGKPSHEATPSSTSPDPADELAEQGVEPDDEGT